MSDMRPAPAISANQWSDDMRYFNKNFLSIMRLAFTDYAIGAGTRDPESEKFVKKPSTEEETFKCGSQIMKKSGGFA